MFFLNKLKRKVSSVTDSVVSKINGRIGKASYDSKLMLGQILLESKRSGTWNQKQFIPETWDDFGFQVYSQSNEDGLIQYLIENVEIKNHTFIEFGVEDYTESNTRFLLLNNNWSGFIMDGSKKYMDDVRSSDIYWKYDIKAIDAFITKENINDLIRQSGFDYDVGILSVDIDGVDYWVWDSIDCISPRIVICEFNPIFGGDLNVTVPYRPDFYRTNAHYSNLYWGGALQAFVGLAKKKGYKLVCINQLRHNAFFVRNDVKTTLKEIDVSLAYKEAKYKESRDENGKLSFLGRKKGLELIGDKEVVDLTDGQVKKIKTLLNNS